MNNKAGTPWTRSKVVHAVKGVFSKANWNALNKEIDGAKETIRKAVPKVKAQVVKEMAAAERTQRDLTKKSGALTAEGGRRWKKLKADVKHDVHGIGKTVKNLFKR